VDTAQASDPLQSLEVAANRHLGAVEFRRKCADLHLVMHFQRLEYELVTNMHIHTACSTILFVRSNIVPACRIDAVIFDLGGVLLDWNPRHLYRKLFADAGQMERFLGEICTPQWHDAHDRGVATADSCAELATRFPEWSDLIWAWSARSEEMVAGPIAPSVDLLRNLKIGGMPCYALTNMEAETYPLRLRRFPFLSWFDGTVVSGHEGMAKPDREIFVLLLDRFALKASTTLMIDDTLENLTVAEQVGLQTFHFHSPQGLKDRLESLSLLPPHP
jgi:2-haloacid dehalogenase